MTMIVIASVGPLASPSESVRERLLFADFTCPPSVRDLREREILPIYG